MNGVVLVFLIVQGLVFLVWAVLAFRWLFALRAEAVALSGRTLPNMATQWRVFRAGFTHPRYHRQRVQLGVLTVVLLALSAASVWVLA